MLSKEDEATLIGKESMLLKKALDDRSIQDNIGVFFKVYEYQQNKRVILLLLQIGERTYLVVKNHQNSETIVIDTYGNKKERISRLSPIFRMLKIANPQVIYIGNIADSHLIDNNVKLFANESNVDYTIRESSDSLDLRTVFRTMSKQEYKDKLSELETEKRENWLPNQDFYKKNLLDSDLTESVASIFAIREMYSNIS